MQILKFTPTPNFSGYTFVFDLEYLWAADGMVNKFIISLMPHSTAWNANPFRSSGDWRALTG